MTLRKLAWDSLLAAAFCVVFAVLGALTLFAWPFVKASDGPR